ncbi:ZP domain-containing protein [Caerostris extrusa]|uniref:ZP domain-containing protein n=1 Tax=Caerostris extrusa TaxID=172846 RepID=A0AAV4U6X4_CAEEX|nr:ZP domain-containing protein [Caerostris extrusa]
MGSKIFHLRILDKTIVYEEFDFYGFLDAMKSKVTDIKLIHTKSLGLVYNVTCGSDLMQLTLNLTNHPASIVYLQNLKGYPGCEAIQKDNLLIFQLSLNESGVHCGVSKDAEQTDGQRYSNFPYSGFSPLSRLFID